MREYFRFRFSPQSTSDENIERWAILSLILIPAPQTSFQYLPETKLRLTAQELKKLIVRGLSDNVVLSEIKTHDKAFDVSPGFGGSQFLLDSACRETVR
jgi:hypothetical protein